MFPARRSEITIGQVFGMQEDSLRVKEARLIPIVLVDVGAEPKIVWDGVFAWQDTLRATAQTP